MSVRTYVSDCSRGRARGGQLHCGVRPESALWAQSQKGSGRVERSRRGVRPKSLRRQQRGGAVGGRSQRDSGRDSGPGLLVRREDGDSPRVSAGHTGLSVCICLGLSGQDLKNVSRAAMAAGEEKRFPATGHRSVPADPQLPQSGQAATVSAVRGEDRASHC